MLPPSARSSAARPTSILRAALALLITATGAHAAFTTFETGQVRPLALSPDGTKLFATNTPDNRLEIFSVSGAGLTHTGSVPVGQPLAVAARSNSEVWVVNHLSDSISIIDVGTSPPRHAYPARRRRAARCPRRPRRQSCLHHRRAPRAELPRRPQLTTPASLGPTSAFDATNLDNGSPTPTLGGVPITVLAPSATPRARSPRALTAARSRRRVPLRQPDHRARA
jgi:hypothetical protein